eukprot:CAMPEP_0179085846 /NCGR_PEP_ID=MMETSP0796-20121207/38902_1 /TAXON_ID=73915 /ORGANISM="Pyrodinium bahamense, Strain pbaha01" /LENGTH=205 /DNA_ID=CAMNT_0020783293 /DNA_START=183 /DNA_END=799 /DNA_ORIENTATION=-
MPHKHYKPCIKPTAVFESMSSSWHNTLIRGLWAVLKRRQTSLWKHRYLACAQVEAASKWKESALISTTNPTLSVTLGEPCGELPNFAVATAMEVVEVSRTGIARGGTPGGRGTSLLCGRAVRSSLDSSSLKESCSEKVNSVDHTEMWVPSGRPRTGVQRPRLSMSASSVTPSPDLGEGSSASTATHPACVSSSVLPLQQQKSFVR